MMKAYQLDELILRIREKIDTCIFCSGDTHKVKIIMGMKIMHQLATHWSGVTGPISTEPDIKMLYGVEVVSDKARPWNLEVVICYPVIIGDLVGEEDRMEDEN